MNMIMMPWNQQIITHKSDISVVEACKLRKLMGGVRLANIRPRCVSSDFTSLTICIYSYMVYENEKK